MLLFVFTFSGLYFYSMQNCRVPHTYKAGIHYVFLHMFYDITVGETKKFNDIDLLPYFTYLCVDGYVIIVEYIKNKRHTTSKHTK